ncbi:MAG: hypothetical protein FWF59_04735 [Turicibacter sp.]|nr:hypothetical protein [Turicibacter sp.]
MAKTSKAVRRGIYFSEEDSDLLAFIDSQEVSASKFVTQIIREKKEGRLGNAPASDDLTNRQLLKELKTLIESRSFAGGASEPAPYNQIQSSDDISYGGVYSNVLSSLDDF